MIAPNHGARKSIPRRVSTDVLENALIACLRIFAVTRWANYTRTYEANDAGACTASPVEERAHADARGTMRPRVSAMPACDELSLRHCAVSAANAPPPRCSRHCCAQPCAVGRAGHARASTSQEDPSGNARGRPARLKSTARGIGPFLRGLATLPIN